MTSCFQDDFLTCAVCYDLYVDPRTLSCGHTFCLSCLQNYTQANDDAIQAKSVPCPVCRQLTKAPDSRCSVEKWAEQMKHTTVVQELSDMMAICNTSEEREESKFTSTATSKEMQCERHKKKMDFFCKDCQITICPLCHIGTHKACLSVVPLDSYLPDIKSELSETREKLLRTSEVIKESRRVNQEKIRQRKNDQKHRIRNMCQKVIDAVKEKEGWLLEDLDNAAEKLVSKIQLGVRLSERTATIQQQQSELIDKVMQSGSDLDKYRMFKICQKLYFEDEGSIGNAHLSQFVFRNKIETVVEVLDDMLGNVAVEYGAESVTPSLDVDDVIVVRTMEEEEDPFLVDVVMVSFLDVQALVVSDNSNCSVKSFYMGESGLLHSRLPFTSSPWGLARLVTNQVLVALPDSHHIARLKVTPDLQIISKLTTIRKYRSVAALSPSTFAAGSSSVDDPCVDILDLEGQVLKSFTSQFPVKNPSYLCPLSNGKFLVSDFGLGSVTTVTSDGSVDYTYKRGLEGPSGVAVTSSGGMVVVDRQKGSLVQYDAYDKHSLQRPKYTSLAVSCEKAPWGVCFDPSGRLFITQGEVIRVITNIVSVPRQNSPVYWNY